METYLSIAINEILHIFHIQIKISTIYNVDVLLEANVNLI